MKFLPAPLSISNSQVSTTSMQRPTTNQMNGAAAPMHLNSDLMWRFPLGFPLTPQTPTSPYIPNDFNNHLPNGLTQDPRGWSHQDVVSFLKWCQREFDLRPFDLDKFQFNGKALCLLTKDDLSERSPNAGDVVYNVLQLLIRDAQSLQRTLPSSPITPTSRYSYTYPATNWHFMQQNAEIYHSTLRQSSTQQFLNNSVTLSPAPSIDSQAGSPKTESNNHANQISATNNGITSAHQSDSDDDSDQDNTLKINTSPPLTPLPRSPNNVKVETSAFKPVDREFFPNSMSLNNFGDHTEPNTNGRLLWDFLQQLLNDPSQRYSNYICWKSGETGVFKIVDPAGLARLWGIQKNHLSMNYDKMSRALRYYYRVNILRKVQGERHCYQFLCNPNELKNVKNISLLRHQIAQSKKSVTSTGVNTLTPTASSSSSSSSSSVAALVGANFLKMNNNSNETLMNMKKEFENVMDSSESPSNNCTPNMSSDELPFDLRINSHPIDHTIMSGGANSVKLEK